MIEAGRQAMRPGGGETYESLRPYLFAVAYRMTGTASDAEDLVQDAWIRYLDAGSPAVTSLKAYLTTIVSRLTLDHLKSARTTRETYVGTWLPEPVATQDVIAGPEATIEQREAVSIAFLSLLESLTPDQRVVFVLRSGFGLPFAEIGEHLGRSSAACRQLYQRAERVIRSASAEPAPRPALPAQEAIVERLLAALDAGDARGVAALLAEQVTWVGDGGAHQLTVRRPVHGADKVARGLIGVATKFPCPDGSRSIEDLNGQPTIVVREAGVIVRVTTVDIEGGRIVAVRSVLNPDKLRHLIQSDRRASATAPAPLAGAVHP